MIRLLHAVEEGFLSLLLVAMTLLVFVEVLMRFVFNTGIAWAQELTLYLSAWFVLLGAAYGIRVHAHIGVDAVVKLLPGTLRRAIAAIALLLCLVYCGLFLAGSWTYLSKMFLIGIELDDLPVPKWVAQGPLLVGFALLLVRFLELLWAVYKGTSLGFDCHDEARESLQIADQLKKDGGGSA
ncbi:MAG: TRAP transporter small permease [Chromatiales bacterium]|nr:TRAP transporter small permease [Chromatiales bacterium]